MAAVRLSEMNPFRAMCVLLSLVLCSHALVGCDDETARSVNSVTIDGRTFHLELALDNDSRFQGLSGRTEIDEDGGMLFAFKHPAVHQFVMRDCPVPIDIIFVDRAGRVTAAHQMTVEPREEGEEDGPYDARLTRYSSKYPAQFVIELRGGTLSELDIESGDRIDLDIERLTEMAK